MSKHDLVINNENSFEKSLLKMYVQLDSGTRCLVYSLNQTVKTLVRLLDNTWIVRALVGSR